MSEYEVVVGMECHAELLTNSKMFCGCANDFGGAPNTRTCPVCLGLPGSLPVPNRKAVELTVKAALALNCEISRDCLFARKNYFYPDLPKGYQISQYENPIGEGGWLDITLANGETKRIKVRRVHLEEDTGKLIHAGGNESEVDYNRSGVPLMEIVTEFPPDILSAEEAKAYLEKLRDILVFLGVSDGKMEEGHLRAEPNVSVRKAGDAKLGTKTELKNLNSFSAVERGIAYELERQSEIIENGGSIRQETLGWNDAAGKTYHMRYKEEEQEYRYFPEPDLIPLHFDDADIARWKSELPELRDAKIDRWVSGFGISRYDAFVGTTDIARADFNDDLIKNVVATIGRNPTSQEIQEAFKLSNVSLAGVLNKNRKMWQDAIPVIGDIAKLTIGLSSGSIPASGTIAALTDLVVERKQLESVIVERSLSVVSDEGAIAAEVDKVLAANPDVVAKIKGGNVNSKGFLVGQVMKATRGQARPDLVNKLIDERLG